MRKFMNVDGPENGGGAAQEETPVPETPQTDTLPGPAETPAEEQPKGE